MTTHTILVTGIGGPAGISATNYLKSQGYHVIGTDMRTVSSNVDHFIEVPAAGEASFIPAILKIIRDYEVSLLIPTVSEELPVVAKELDSFAPYPCRVVIAPYAAVDIANDKLKTAVFLDQHGVSVPRTLAGDTAHASVLASIGLPLIAKPRISRGGRGVKLHTSPQTLAEEQRSNIVYQEFISGEEYDVNLFVGQQGEMRSCVVLHKTQLRDGVVGNALAVERVQAGGVAEVARRAVAALGLTGPADIDIRVDSSGTPRLLEINARLGANVLSAKEVMEDLLSEWKASL